MGVLMAAIWLTVLGSALHISCVYCKQLNFSISITSMKFEKRY